MTHLRIGTRKSKLALAQTQFVADALVQAHPGLTVELVKIITTGDQTKGPLVDVGGKGLFTIQLEAALDDGSIDLAVHSAKDLPTDLDERFCIAAVCQRADCRDVLVTRSGGGLERLKPGAKVGTGSLRRMAQIRQHRPDVEVIPIRGNVDTRLAKVLSMDPDGIDGVVLAKAGLERLDLWPQLQNEAAVLDFLPAVGQGTLAIETLTTNEKAKDLLKALDHAASHESLVAERQVLADLHADCHSCIAVYVAEQDGAWVGQGLVACEDGSDMVTCQVKADSAFHAGLGLAEALKDAGAMRRLGH